MFEGRCHCGNISVRFDPETPPDQIQVRACGCTFCRRHGAKNVTDRAGTLAIRVKSRDDLSLYTFGFGVTEFMICRRCGCYAAAIQREGEKVFATLNIQVLEDSSAFTRPVEPVDYDTEPKGERVKRRLEMWTPTEISFG